MCDKENPPNTKDIIDATTALVKAVPIYEDLVQPAAKELGIALETITKTVNLALTPISGLIWSYESIKDFVSSNVSEKLKNVPPENIETPDPLVAGPAIEALRYAGHEETLRNMYANLLANALDKETKSNTHPSFVEVIKQLSPSEANLLLILCQLPKYPDVCSYVDNHSIQGGQMGGAASNGIKSNRVMIEFEKLCQKLKLNIEINPNSALDNFRRLQIIDIESVTKHKIEDSFFGPHANDISGKLELRTDHSEKLHFSSYGQKFIETCVSNKT
jgi:abortive infection alpha-like protein